MNISTQESKRTTLADAWRGILQAKPDLRIREAAKQLNVSEAELLATKTGDNVIRLQTSWPDLLHSFKTLGRVMSLTRNDACILENKGSFQKIDVVGSGAHSMAAVVGPIESRVFFSAWHTAFAATEEKSGRTLKSIQVFDKAGEAITKIYLQEESRQGAFEKIIADFRADDQYADLDVKPWPEETSAANVDTEAFLKEWSELKDTHDFFGMIRRHQLQRYRAVEVAEGRFTHRVDPKQTPKQILDQASASKFPIMIFAGNRGNIQIHQGKVRTIRLLERGAQPWLNVLDPDFNMHLRMDLVHDAWVVRKPTTEGDVTAVELFSREQELIAQFFGLRKPGIPEREGWREIVSTLPAYQQ